MSKSIEDINISIYNNQKVVQAYGNWKEISNAESIALNFSKQIEPAILDIGCGTGRHYEKFKKLNANYLGIDISNKMISEAKRQYKTTIFNEISILDFKSSEKFDTIILMHNGIDLFYPLERRVKVLSKISSLLKPDGKFIFSSHIPNWLNKKEKKKKKNIKISFIHFYHKLFKLQKGYLPEDYRGTTIYQYRASSHEIQKQMINSGFKVEIIIPDYSKEPIDWNYYVCSLQKSAANNV